MYKIDLHTHSSVSHDGGITPAQYKKVLSDRLLDCIAVTDHNRIDFALKLQAELGNVVIVGEEIMTTAGEIIGLFLTEAVPAGLMPLEAIQAIKEQNGIVYIPHPFESVRHGLHPGLMDDLLEDIDIIEVCNGRALMQDRSAQALLYAKLNKIINVSSSDAHGILGLGKTYTRIHEMPKHETLLSLLKNGTLITDRPSMRSLLYPKYNKLKKKMRAD